MGLTGSVDHSLLMSALASRLLMSLTMYAAAPPPRDIASQVSLFNQRGSGDSFTVSPEIIAAHGEYSQAV